MYITDGNEPTWIKSSFCASGQCVEFALVGDHVLLRDSKSVAGPVLRFELQEWAAFVQGVMSGEFDLP